MTTARKTTTTTKKTTTKTTAKKKHERLDWANLTVSGTELAELLGLTLPNITAMRSNGNIVPDEEGRYNLKEAVFGYCKRMREKKVGDGASKSELELENMALKNEKLKTSLRTWRVQRDREIGLAIIQGMVSVMTDLKEQCKLVPKLPEAIDDMIKAIQEIDMEQISYLVEGETEEEDE